MGKIARRGHDPTTVVIWLPARANAGAETLDQDRWSSHRQFRICSFKLTKSSFRAQSDRSAARDMVPHLGVLFGALIRKKLSESWPSDMKTIRDGKDFKDVSYGELA